MKKADKINYLKDHMLSEWLSTRRQVADELSSKQSLICCCGRLASGLHESMCRKFNTKIDNETLSRLKHLISKGELYATTTN
jgi:hypothetical protein